MDDEKPEDTSGESKSEIGAFTWLPKETVSLTEKLSELAKGSLLDDRQKAMSEDVVMGVKLLREAVIKAAKVYDGLKSTQAEIYVELEQTKAGQAALQEQLEEARTYASAIISSASKEIDEHRNNTLAAFEKGVSAAQAAFTEQQAIREPVVLWKEKQREHVTAKRWGLGLFIGGLLIAAGFVVALIYGLATQPDYVQALLAPIGCDPKQPSSACSGFSLKGVLLAAGVLTLFTLLLWFIRLQMKLYLAERHLALDAREREAFAQSYLGLVREGDVSEEAKEQRALVYAALFRPSSDGTVKDEGGMDPSIAAALAKFLMK
ncbi:DUF6161 domain-containing protein [Pseudophaeobacter arcticus]|uniref:DUF6161 domain-containing protein n=1 Tax=Pseudophaeobacter arcticus TaxID=385492 RepID=UPI003A97047B